MTPIIEMFIDDVKESEHHDGYQDGPWDRARRLADFFADQAYVVIAAEIVHGNQRCSAKPQKKLLRRMKGAGQKWNAMEALKWVMPPNSIHAMMTTS